MSDDKHVITRRDFVRGTVGATLGVAAMGGTLEALAAPVPTSHVVLVREQWVLDGQHAVNLGVLKIMLRNVLTKVTGKPDPISAWRSLVKTDDVIGLVATDHLNKTHPELIELVQASLMESGVPRSNIRDAQGGPEKARACTALIALPALKAHWLTGIGTVLKNYITLSGNPSGYHGANNANLGEIWNMPHVKGKTKLVVVDALRPLCDKGPQPDPRYLWDYKGLIAGGDPVAVEAVCLKVILQKRQALRGEPWPLSPPPLCVEMADRKYGLGTSRMEQIQLDRIGWTADALV
ncbi:MAG: DUF362 domain-containing protein [Acidobacteriia bacterium]|nr:DUF362 domain-containing protein [Terriglobia bacterium]